MDQKNQRNFQQYEKIKNILGLTPKHTLKDAMREIKKAFEKGLIVYPSITIYKNIERMKEIGVEKLMK